MIYKYRYLSAVDMTQLIIFTPYGDTIPCVVHGDQTSSIFEVTFEDIIPIDSDLDPAISNAIASDEGEFFETPAK